MPVKLNSTGGGSVTLDTPSTASNYTVTLPSSAGTLLNTGTTSFTFAGAGTISATTTLTLNGGAGSNGLVLDTSNNVGIGTASVTEGGKLSLVGAKSLVAGIPQGQITASDSTALATGVGGAINFSGVYTSGGSVTSFASVEGYKENATSGDYAAAMVFKTRTNGGSQIERMRLDSSGNLGLGLTPSAWWDGVRAFQVWGAALFSSGSTSAVTANTYLDSTITWRYINSTNATRYEQLGGAHSWYYAASGTAGNAISFTQAMTLDANGKLLIGDTSTTPGAARIQVTFNGAAYNGIDVKTTASGTSYLLSFFNSSNTGVGNITTNGSTTSYNPSSDISLKENIKPITNGLERVAKLKPVDYNWKADGTLDNGFIAQDLLATEEFAHRCNIIDTKEDGTDVYGVDYMKFVAVLTAAIQELSAKNSELESRLAALEGK